MNAQLIKTINEAEDLLKKATQLKEQTALEKACLLLGELETFFEQAEEWTLYLETLDQLCEALNYCCKTKAAKNKAQKGLEITHQYFSSEHYFIAVFGSHLGQSLQQENAYDLAFAEQEKALNLLVETHPEKYLILANVYDRVGKCYQFKKEVKKSLEYYQKALSIRENMLRIAPTELIKSYIVLGMYHAYVEKINAVVDYAEKAIQIEEDLGFHTPQSYVIYLQLSVYYLYKNDRGKSVFNLKKGIEINEQYYGEKHPTSSSLWGNLGAIYQIKGKNKRAIEHYRKAINVISSKEGIEHLNVAFCHNNISTCYAAMGRYKKALKYHKRSLEIKLKIVDENHFIIAQGIFNRGGLYAKQGLYKEAIVEYKEATKRLKKILGETHEKVGYFYAHIGSAYLSLGLYDEAFSYYESGLQIMEKAVGDLNALTVFIYAEFGLYYLKQGAYDQVIDYQKRALSFSLKNLGINHSKTAIPYFILALSYYEKGNYTKAIEHHEQALVISLKTLGETHIQTISCYIQLGICYKKKDNYSQALEYLNKSEKLISAVFTEHPEMAQLLKAIGLCEESLGFTDKALATLEKGLTIALKTLGKEHPTTAQLYNHIGTCYQHKGDLKQAHQYYKQALNIFEKRLADGHIEYALIYFNLGYCALEEKDYKTALSYLNQSLSIRQQFLGEDHPDTVNTYSLLGHCYHAHEMTDRAIEYQQKALIIQIDNLGEWHKSVSESNLRLGQYFEALGQYKIAMNYYDKCLGGRLKTFGFQHYSVVEIYAWMANCSAKMNDYSTAFQHIQQSLKCLDDKLSLDKKRKNPPIEKILGNHQALMALEIKARLLRNYYKEESQNEKDLKAALHIYELGIELVQSIRASFIQEDSKLFLSKNTATFIEGGIQTALKLYEKNEEFIYLEHVFAFIESGKSMVLLSDFQEVKARSIVGVPEKILRKEESLRLALTKIKLTIKKEKGKQKSTKNKLNALEQKAFEIHKKHQQLLKKIERNYPAYRQLKSEIALMDLKTLQGTIEQDTAFLEYYIGENNLYLFVITTNDIRFLDLGDSHNLSIEIQALFLSLEELERKTYIQQASKLYNVLLKEALKELTVTNLVIIPDGELNLLPFDALLTFSTVPINSKIHYVNLPYLLLNYSLSYHFSATLYVRGLQQEETSNEKNTGFLGFAPVHFQSGELRDKSVNPNKTLRTETFAQEEIEHVCYETLEHSEKEVNGIAELFKENNLSVATYLHQEATIENFRESIGKYKYILIAAHGVYNSDEPDLSGILFSPTTKATSNKQQSNLKETILHLADAYNLKINADLLVLSCCESGIGEIHKGEGIMGINRGFLFAGSQQVICTLFKVYDDASSQLTKRLFFHILAGNNHATALRKAKLDLIQEKGVDPMCWAGFVLIG